MERKRERPSVIISIVRANKSKKNRATVVELNGNSFIVPVIEIPFTSTRDQALDSITTSLNLLDKILQKLVKSQGQLEKVNENVELLSEIKDDLGLTELPALLQESWDLLSMVSDALPYIGSALKILRSINTWKSKQDLKSLENQLLIVIDDVADLKPNWEMLSGLLEYNFFFLIVGRVNDPKDYVNLLQDTFFTNKYLQELGLSSIIHKSLVLPLPAHGEFTSIAKINGIEQDRIEELWTSTGGIPAVALMMWEASKMGNLDEIIIEAKKTSKDPSSRRAWELDDIPTRIAYTLLATKDILLQLRHQNYSYLALSVQPIGLSSDELSLFCACMFGRMCSCNNHKVKELYDLFVQSGFKFGYNNVEFVDSPCVGERCSHILDSSIVRSDAENWTRVVVNNKTSFTHLPTIEGQGGKRVLYSFNSLFTHIPVLLNEIAKDDKDLLMEINKARRVLLMILGHECSLYGGHTDRALECSLNHIIQIGDLSESTDTVISLLTLALLSSPFLVMKNWERLKTKINGLRFPITPKYGLFVVTISDMARSTGHDDFLSETITHANNLESSEDRFLLFCLARIYTNLAFIFLNRKDFAKANKYQNFAEAMLKILSSKEDTLSIYAKTNILPQSAQFYFTTQNNERVKHIIEDALVAISQLENMNEASFHWMSEIGIDKNHDLMKRKAQIYEIWGTLLQYADQLEEAIEKYKIARNVEASSTSLRHSLEKDALIYETSLINSSDDQSFQEFLKRLSEIDKKLILGINQKQVDYSLTLEALTSFHARAVIARAALKYFFGSNDDLNLNDLLIINPHTASKLYGCLSVLEKMFTDKINVEKYLQSILSYLSEHDKKGTLAIALFYAAMKDQTVIKIEDAEKQIEIPVELIRQELVKTLDEASEHYLCTCCRLYRDIQPYGVIMEYCCQQLYKMQTLDDRLLSIAHHMIFEKFNCVYLEIKRIEEHSKIPLLNRLLKELRKNILKYERKGDPILTVQSRRDFIKSYLRLWYFFQT